MYAIVTLLDEPAYSKVKALWQELGLLCDMSGIDLMPLPHFSWHTANEYDVPRLRTILLQIAKQNNAFSVRTSGLGIFTGESPVIYIPLARNDILSSVHQQVWRRVEPVAVDGSSHYAPEIWIQHITLAHGDVSPDRLGCAMEQLAYRQYDWEIQVDNLALVYQIGSQIGELLCKYPFGGGEACV